MTTYNLDQFQQLTREDLEKNKFWLDSSWKVAVRVIRGISSRGVPVETWDDLPLSGIIEWHAIVVYNDPILGSTLAIWNGSMWIQSWGSGWLVDCSDVKDCIENFTDLDLSNLETLILGWDITFAENSTIDRTNTTNTGVQNFDEDYVANYDGSEMNYNDTVFNYTGDNIVNLTEGNSITYNMEWTVNNEYGSTYIEVNNYAEGAIFNYEGSVINAYNNYTENNSYENTIINNEWDIVYNYNNYTEVNNYDESSSVTYIGGDHYYENVTINYDENSSVSYEWDVNITNLTVQNITIEWGWTVQMTGAWEYEETPLEADTYTLLNTPISEKWFMVFVDSGTGLFPTTDYTYDIVTQEITFSPQLWATEKAIIWVMKGTGTVWPTINPVEPAVPMIDAEFWDYILVTYTLGASVINLPDATLKDGWQIRIKKFTGEDVLTTTIVPQSWQLIDGFTWATMNINRTMYTFTAINGNRYLGD